ncbi:MAG: M20/M25/M40 family metallo-hydrolase [Kofleriaceae bacterium]
MRALAILMMLCATAAADCPDDMMADLKALSSKELDGRAPGTDGDVKARALVVDRMKCLGLDPQVQTFDKTANVIGTLKGTSDEIVIVSAHLDHLGNGHLGANDDASGVAALLHIAAQIKNPTRTIVFAAFGDEESGMVGSHYFAKHPLVDLDHVVQFVELDMVGSYASADLVAAMGAFKGFGSRAVLDKRLKEFPKLHVSAGGKARGSDFEPFCELGVPYVFFWTPDHRCYHETCDTFDRIDQKHMIEIVKLATAFVQDLADTDTTLRTKKGCGV